MVLCSSPEHSNCHPQEGASREGTSREGILLGWYTVLLEVDSLPRIVRVRSVLGGRLCLGLGLLSRLLGCGRIGI